MTLRQSSVVAIGGRAILIEGAPGTGKSSLALALIDRGAVLIGDDGVSLAVSQSRLFASPPPGTAGLLEIRGVGLVSYPVVGDVPAALVITLSSEAPRFIEGAESLAIEGISIPAVALYPDSPVLALRAEAALKRYGLG